MTAGRDNGFRQVMTVVAIPTRGPGLIDLTAIVGDWLAGQCARDGLLTVYVRHTSASLLVQENADPDVRRDLLDALARLAPEREHYRHASEGPDDMPAHIKAALTPTSITIPVMDGAPALGTWQGLFLVEHRAAPHRREVALHFMGEVGPG
jgi:secondary thiamine-phosphate synthase enzyme